jgi:hypothetical protein
MVQHVRWKVFRYSTGQEVLEGSSSHLKNSSVVLCS